jgi:hypothetical protein
MRARIEDYWYQLQHQWLSHAFPFSRDTFRRIVIDITENQYTSAEAIVKHIAEGSGIEPPEFTRLMMERFQRQLHREDALEFVDGYGKLTMLLQAGFLLAAEGPLATEEIIRQWRLSMSRERVNFLAENIEPAASLIKQDPTGRTMMMRFADTMTRTSKRTYFNEGVRTALDTFMGYSKSLEEYMKGSVQ